MKFKNILLFSIILLAIFSISTVSAEDISLGNDVIGVDIDDTNDLNDNNLINEDLIGSDVSDENSSSIKSSDLTMYYKNGSQYQATFYDFNGTPIVGEKVPISVNGGNYQRTTNANGTIKFNINLPVGTYVLTVTNPVTNEKASNNITVLSTIYGNDLEKIYKNASQYKVTVLNGQGLPSVGSVVSFNINGVFYNRTTKQNGIANMNINLNSGNYIITAENTLNGEKTSNNITVSPSIKGKNVKMYYQNGTQYLANFTDSQGNPLKNTVVTFNINGVFYNRTTNANGTARLNIKLDQGNYIITAYNPVTTEKASNTIEVLSTIVVKNAKSGNNISIEYNNNGKYTVELHNKNGSLATGKDVTFNINGVFYKRTSNANGTASLNIKLLPGDYIITAEFEGCRVSNLIKVRISTSIKLLNSTVKSNDYIKFRMTEKLSGNPVTGNHIGIVYFNGTNYGAYPDDTGLVQLRVGLPVGNYLFYIGNMDDGWYSSTWIGNTIKVI